MTIGVLALQGAVREHLEALRRCGVEALPVRTAEEIGRCDGLILPGGESTTIGKLMDRYGLIRPIKDLAASGRPVLGTCAGMILMAKEIESGIEGQPRLGLMDITVERNAFGRQVESFEADLDFQGVNSADGAERHLSTAAHSAAAPVRAVFIRAPLISAVGDGVRVLARHGGRVVAAQQGNLLALAFHPELTDDSRIHRYFLSLAHVGQGAPHVGQERELLPPS